MVGRAHAQVSAVVAHSLRPAGSGSCGGTRRSRLSLPPRASSSSSLCLFVLLSLAGSAWSACHSPPAQHHHHPPNVHGSPKSPRHRSPATAPPPIRRSLPPIIVSNVTLPALSLPPLVGAGSPAAAIPRPPPAVYPPPVPPLPPRPPPTPPRPPAKPKRPLRPPSPPAPPSPIPPPLPPPRPRPPPRPPAAPPSPSPRPPSPKPMPPSPSPPFPSPPAPPRPPRPPSPRPPPRPPPSPPSPTYPPWPGPPPPQPPAPAPAGPKQVAIYIDGIFDVPSPNATTLSQLTSWATRVSASGAAWLMLSFLHVGPNGTLSYSRNAIVDADGNTTRAYRHLPALLAIMRSNGAQLLWTIGGWAVDRDWRYLDATAFAHLDVLLKWSGATGIDLDPEPIQYPMRHYEGQIVNAVRWAASQNYLVTATAFTDVTTWVSILQLTVVTVRGVQRQLLDRLHCQLYGDPDLIEEMRPAIEEVMASAGLASEQALDEFLWPGWAPCLFNVQPTYPTGDAGYLVGKSTAVIQAAVAAQENAYQSQGIFLWEWGLMEALPTRTQLTCVNMSARSYAQAAMVGLMQPKPVAQQETFCASLQLNARQDFHLKAVGVDGRVTGFCGTPHPNGWLSCGRDVTAVKLRVCPFNHWLPGRRCVYDGGAHMNMSASLVFYTAQSARGKPAFVVAYDGVAKLLYLTPNILKGVPPANLQLVRQVGTLPTVVPATGRTRGPLRLRVLGDDPLRYCTAGDRKQVYCRSLGQVVDAELLSDVPWLTSRIGASDPATPPSPLPPRPSPPRPPPPSPAPSNGTLPSLPRLPASSPAVAGGRAPPPNMLPDPFLFQIVIL